MIVHARRADIRMAEPLLHLRDVGALIKRARSGGSARGVGTEPIHRLV